MRLDADAPSAPPPLKGMAARKEKLEAERAALFEQWKKALEEHEGNVTKASTSMGKTRDWGASVTRRFRLGAYASSLRIKARGHDLGRPWPKRETEK